VVEFTSVVTIVELTVTVVSEKLRMTVVVFTVPVK